MLRVRGFALLALMSVQIFAEEMDGEKLNLKKAVYKIEYSIEKLRSEVSNLKNQMRSVGIKGKFLREAGNDVKEAQREFRNMETRTCGGIVQIGSEVSSFISYKEGENYSNNEFCVWTLQNTQNLKSVRILSRTRGFETGHDGLVVFQWTGSSLQSFKVTKDETIVQFSGPFLYLAFTSDENGVMPGFRVKLTGQGPSDTSPSAQAFFFDSVNGKFPYPDNTGSHYGNNAQLSVLVQAQTNGRDTRREMILKDVDTEYKRDRIHVYSLLGYHSPYTHALEQGSWSGNFTGEDSEILPGLSTVTPTLYLFASDDDRTGTGFTVAWNDQLCG